MSQAGFTPISIYYSSTAGNTPTAGNLVAGELAINTADGKLFYKDSSGVVQVIAGKGGAGVAGGSNTQVQYNSSGSLAGSANFTFNGTTVTIANDASISGLTVGKGSGSIASNTTLGYLTLASNTTGNQNAAFGYQALVSNTSGANNIAMGWNAVNGNTTGSSNVGLGVQALFNNTTASENTAVGYVALYTNSTGTQNTAIGGGALNLATGSLNTACGYNAGAAITTGAKNTIIGRYSGNAGGLDIRTASNYIVLSDGDGNPRQIINTYGKVLINQTASIDGSGSTAAQLEVTQTADNDVVFLSNSNASPYGINIKFSAASPNGTGNQFFYCADTTTSRFIVRSNGGIANYSANNVNLSDERTKKDIKDAGNYLDKICAIPVRTFLYKDQTDDQLNLGVIAQEVEAVAPELVDVGGFGDTPEDGIPLKAIYQTDLQYALMKALQELKAEFDAYKASHP